MHEIKGSETSLYSDAEAFISGDSLAGVKSRALWPKGQHWSLIYWANLCTALLSENQNWDVWTRWYDAVLAGNPTPGGEELDIYRVTLDGEDDWKKGPAHVNALIKAKEEEIARRGHRDQAPLDLLQYPASFNFDFLNGQLIATPVTGGGSALPEADDMRFELIGKLEAAAQRLKRTQCVSRYPETMLRAAKLLELHPAAELPAGKLLMVFRSIEADALAITSPEGRSEIAADAIALVEDAWRSFEDFKAQLPNLIKLETNRLALSLATTDSVAMNVKIEELSVAASRSVLLSVSAKEAVAEGRDEFERFQQSINPSSTTMEVATAKEAQAAIVAQRAMVVRNLVVRPLKFVADKTVAGIGCGIEKSAEALTISAISALMASIAGPLMGMAVFIASFRPLARKAEDVGNNTNGQMK